jgi:solute carrier family 10 (sodium/bile acid cotransporter), member 7
MLAVLRKRWFLFLIAIGLTIAWQQPEWLRWTSRVDPHWVVALSLFLGAWGLDSRILLRTLVRPAPALWAVTVSYGLLPAFAWLIGQFLPGNDFRIGLIIIASVPCTLASAVIWTRMGGGNEAIALLVIFMTVASSWLATTAWVAWATGTVVDTTAMMADLLVALLVPVAVAQLLRLVPMMAWAATHFQKPIGIGVQLLVWLIMMKAAVDVNDRLSRDPAGIGPLWLGLTGVLCVGTHLAGLAAGFWGGRWIGFERPSQVAIAFSCSQKTLPVGLFLFDAYFRNYPLAVVAMVFYHAGQLVVDTFIADAFRAAGERTAGEEYGETGGLPLET